MEEEDENEEEVKVVLKRSATSQESKVLCRGKGSRRKKIDLSKEMNNYNGFRTVKKKRRGKEHEWISSLL